MTGRRAESQVCDIPFGYFCFIFTFCSMNKKNFNIIEREGSLWFKAMMLSVGTEPIYNLVELIS